MKAFLDRQDDELGIVRLCRGCGEEWPKDGEFWFYNAGGKVMGHCKACWSERSRFARVGVDIAFRVPQRIHGAPSTR